MSRHTLLHALFGRFQNLNLAVLREDLRRGLVVRGDWLADDGSLCPIAHGLSAGAVVESLKAVSQAVNLDEACREAARNLGATPLEVYRFVCLWDESARCGPDWLLAELDVLWRERQVDADFTQDFFAGADSRTPSPR